MEEQRIVVVKENRKTVIKIDKEAYSQIWKLVKDWPDIVSNDENLKILADLNLAKPEQIKAFTDDLYQIFKAVTETSGEATICKL